MSIEKRILLLVGFGLLAFAVVLCLPPIPQPQSYHHFADQRSFLGIPHGLNVLSNLPFLVVGVLGVGLVLRKGKVLLLDPRERWPYLAVFTAVGLTAFGSAYYHLEPTNERLVWDRLPIAVAFMAFFAAMLGERLGVTIGLWLLPPLVFLGVASVVGWFLSEREGAGDLRFYGFVQFFPLVAIPLLIGWFLPRYTRGPDVFVALGWYVVAKIAELPAVDRGIYQLGEVVSGHTLKHLASAAGAYWILRMVRLRRPVT